MANICHSCEGARSARIIHWIPACAGMADGVLFAGCLRSFYTACFRRNGGIGAVGRMAEKLQEWQCGIRTAVGQERLWGKNGSGHAFGRIFPDS